MSFCCSDWPSTQLRITCCSLTHVLYEALYSLGEIGHGRCRALGRTAGRLSRPLVNRAGQAFDGDAQILGSRQLATATP